MTSSNKQHDGTEPFVANAVLLSHVASDAPSSIFVTLASAMTASEVGLTIAQIAAPA